MDSLVSSMQKEVFSMMYHLRPKNRLNYIIERAIGKTVLHIGCTNAPNTRLRMAQQSLLHEKLRNVASVLHGIDIDKEGLSYMRGLGYGEIYELDAKNLAQHHDMLRASYDLIVLGDIIEHTTEPENLLRAAHSRVNPSGEVLITVPNAFHLFGFLRALVGVSEITHPEHVAFYSPLNLFELCKRSGLEIVEMRGYYEEAYKESAVKHFFRLMERIGIYLFPGTSCGIICRAQVKKQV